MAFFTNFPVLSYKFGDEILPSDFQNLTIYIDLIDQIADDANFYELYTIIDGERPDVLSYKLYGTTDLYWTFYLLNEKIRRQGWPLTFQEIYNNRSLYYPHKVIKTEDTFFDRMDVGDTVIQGSYSSPTAIGTVVKKDYDHGQIFVRPDKEVRSINVTNGGSGYTGSPTITIYDEHGEKHDQVITNASASATITNGVITALNVISGGKGYQHAPTITISEPQVIDWDEVAKKIELVITGRSETYQNILKFVKDLKTTGADDSGIQKEAIRKWDWDTVQKAYQYEIDNETIGYTTDVYTDLLTETFNGYKRGDIAKKGEITQADADIIRSFANNPNGVLPDYKRRIIDGLKRPILNDYTSYPLWVPHGDSGVTATATPVLSNSTFTNKALASHSGVSDWRNFDPTEIKTISAISVVDQYNAVHHYEDGNGNWVDIDPTDVSSAAAYTPVTYFERLQSQNDDLKIIKILKPDVAQQIYSEYQRLLRDNNVN